MADKHDSDDEDIKALMGDRTITSLSITGTGSTRVISVERSGHLPDIGDLLIAAGAFVIGCLVMKVISRK